MKKFNYFIKDSVGIHARPAGLLVKEAKAFESKITVAKGEKSAEARKLMALMSLGVKCGDEVEITAEGADEEQAIASMKVFFEANL